MGADDRKDMILIVASEDHVMGAIAALGIRDAFAEISTSAAGYRRILAAALAEVGIALAPERCGWGACPRPATALARGRSPGDDHDPVVAYCDDHAKIVEREDSPEYVEGCPNCGCGFGVG